MWEFDDSEHRQTISSEEFIHELRATVLERAEVASSLADRHKAHQLESRHPLRSSIARAFSASVEPEADADCYWYAALGLGGGGPAAFAL